MITREKIKIYNRYNGEIDSWARSGSKSELATMNDNDWFLIDGFIQDIKLVRNGLASETFNNDLSRRLDDNCNDQDTINQLRMMAEDNQASHEDGIIGKMYGLFRRKKDD